MPAPPGRTRLLGRSRRYTGANLSPRLKHWHAPRANRWECLYVMTGAVDTEWLDAARVTPRRLAAGTVRWIPPGTRWRVAHLDADAGFELEVHADETVAPAAPQGIRAVLLDEAAAIDVHDRDELARALAALGAGETRLLRAGFDAGSAIHDALRTGGDAWSWHPLDGGPDGCVALIVRTASPAGLAEYMGRDHAVIEGALAGALRGRPGRMRWLTHALARHLAIEETLLFPPYLASGGNAGWVRGLLNEHRQLREYLPQLDDATGRRRFLLLLDGHDEKEEQIVYPDIVAHVDDTAPDLARQAASYPLEPVPA